MHNTGESRVRSLVAHAKRMLKFLHRATLRSNIALATPPRQRFERANRRLC